MNGIRRAVAFATLCLAALVTAPQTSASIPAPPSQWYGLPGLNAASGAQWVRAFAHSTPPNVVYAGLEGGGVYRSTNGGATWSAFNSGFANPLTTNVRALLASSTGATVWAGTDSGLFRSTGGAWEPVAQGSEDNPADPKKLNESVQSLIGLTGGSTMLAGVFSGGVHRSMDGGETWKPPAANNGMPSSETIYGLTQNIPGLVYASGGSGVYVSTDQGATWARKSDGIPGGASPITTWAYPQRPQILFASTGSNGIYRSINAGLTWSPINTGLGAVRARGLQIFTAEQGAHLYAATEEGLWEALNENSVNPPAPRWKAVTKNGLQTGGSDHVIMWSLTAPVIPGAGALGLIAGTQSNGGYFLSFEPVDSPCPANHTTNTSSNCPRLADATPEVGKELSIVSNGAVQRGTWTGTQFIEFKYQWQRCTTSTSGCTDIPDAEEFSYVVPASGEGLFYRMKVSARNPAPTFGAAVRYSAISSPAAPSASSRPGYNQTNSPPIVVLSPGETTSPEVGDTMRAATGNLTAADPTYGWFNPPATTVTYQWLRCTSGVTDCNEILGATGRQYTLQAADGTHTLKVRVRGTASGLTTDLVSSASYDVTSSPAAIADPIPDPDGGAPISQAPSLAGEAYVGETLAGSVGGWKDPTTDFLRRWVRCDAAGEACSHIQKVASTEPEDGSTYVVRQEDLGSTLRMRVIADVNSDLTPDGLDNHLPRSVEVDTPASAVVVHRPVPPAPPGGSGGTGGGGTGGGTGGPGANPDRTAPVITGLRAARKRLVAGRGTTLRLRISEAASVRVRITKSTKGRKVSGKCRPQTRKNRKRPRCRYDRRITTLGKGVSPAGDVAIKFSGKVRRRKLRPGTYTALVIVTDGAGNVASGRLILRVVRR